MGARRLFFLLAAVLFAVPLFTPSVVAGSENGYWQPVVGGTVNRGAPIRVFLFNIGNMPLAAVRVDVWGPLDLEPRMSFVQELREDERNWTSVELVIQTGRDWLPGAYQVVLQTCNECVSRGNSTWPQLRTALVVSVERNDEDWYAYIMGVIDASEKGEAGWPMIMLGLTSGLWIAATYASHRILKWRQARPVATGAGGIRSHVSAIRRFNLPHSPLTWWRNKHLASMEERRRQLAESLEETERTIAKAKRKAGVVLLGDVAVAGRPVPPPPPEEGKP